MVIGREARSLGIDVVLQPFINIDRDITFAAATTPSAKTRFLNGAMGAAEIAARQAQDVMSMAKHYVAYDSEFLQHITSISRRCTKCTSRRSMPR